jgi:hypothetical protein
MRIGSFFSCASFRTSNQWGFWFRVFGYGLAINNTKPFFSERFGYRKVLRIFGIKIEVLGK